MTSSLSSAFRPAAEPGFHPGGNGGGDGHHRHHCLGGALVLKEGFSTFFAGGYQPGDWQGRVAMERMSRELRDIRFASAADLPTIGANTIRFSMSTAMTLPMPLSGTTLNLTQEPTGAQPLADNVSALAFTYLDQTGTGTAVDGERLLHSGAGDGHGYRHRNHVHRVQCHLPHHREAEELLIMGKRKQRGAALLVAAVVLIIVITTLVVTMSYLTGGATRAGAGNMQSAQALYLAEAGMERAIYRLHFIRTTAPLCDAALDETQSLGAGSYTTTFVRSAPANTTLSDPANLTAADTVIRVARSWVTHPRGGSGSPRELPSRTSIIPASAPRRRFAAEHSLRVLPVPAARRRHHCHRPQQRRCGGAASRRPVRDHLHRDGGAGQRVVRKAVNEFPGAMMVYAKAAGDPIPYYRLWTGTGWERRPRPILSAPAEPSATWC